MILLSFYTYMNDMSSRRSDINYRVKHRCVSCRGSKNKACCPYDRYTPNMYYRLCNCHDIPIHWLGKRYHKLSYQSSGTHDRWMLYWCSYRIGLHWCHLKKQRMNKFKYNHNIVINIYLKFVKFSYICLTEESYFLQLCETCKININEIKKTCWLLAWSEDHIKYIFPKHHHSKFAIMQIIFVLRDWFH